MGVYRRERIHTFILESPATKYSVLEGLCMPNARKNKLAKWSLRGETSLHWGHCSSQDRPRDRQEADWLMAFEELDTIILTPSTVGHSPKALQEAETATPASWLSPNQKALFTVSQDRSWSLDKALWPSLVWSFLDRWPGTKANSSGLGLL